MATPGAGRIPMPMVPGSQQPGTQQPGVQPPLGSMQQHPITGGATPDLRPNGQYADPATQQAALAAHRQIYGQQPSATPPPAGNAFAVPGGFPTAPGPFFGNQPPPTSLTEILKQLPQGSPSPTNVAISPDILNSMSKYADAAYQQAMSRLDPQWAQQSQQMQQQLINQGLQPGSAAYDNAMRDFNNAKGDAYSTARNQAMQQGLQAQGQAFQEGYAGSNLANELAKAQLGANTQIGLGQLGANTQQYLGGLNSASGMFNSLVGADAQKDAAASSAAGMSNAAAANANASMQNAKLNNATTQLLGMGNLGLGYDQLQNQNMSTLGNLALGYGQLQNQSNQNDFSNMMGLAQFGNQQDMYNNALPGMQLGNAMTMLGMVPNGGPAPVDVTGAYGLSQQGQNLNYQGQVANANGQNQTMGALGSAAIMAAMLL